MRNEKDMRSLWFPRKGGGCSLAAVRRGVPHLVDLRTMQQVDLKDLYDCALTRSLEECRYIGSGVVIYFLDPNLIEIGSGCELRDYSILEVGGRLKIGAGSVVGAYNWFQASGNIKIGDGVLSGPYTAFVSTEHEKPGNSGALRDTPLRTGTVTIENNVWIGAHVSVLMNVTIGANTTIGTGSVVTRSIPTGAVAYGSPCRPVSAR